MPAPAYANYVVQGDGYRWGADKGVALGGPVTITYSFATANVHNLSYTNLQSFNETQKTATHAILDYIESFTDITFVETSANAGNIQFLNGDLGPGLGGVAPNTSYGNGGYAWGAVVMNNHAGERLDDKAYIPGEISWEGKGGAAYQTLLHEIAHTLGIKHPHEANAAGDKSSIMPASMDNLTQSSMSYSDYGHSLVSVRQVGPNGEHFFTTGSLKPVGFGISDIAALQYLYGTDTSSTGGKTFAFLPDKPIYLTISDNGPNNTIDLSALTGPNRVDMREGKFSDLAIAPLYPEVAGAGVYDGTRALAIAYGVDVANVIGGSGKDTIIGNDIANLIDGRAGVDRMEGLKGNDTYIVNNAADVIVEIAGGGTADWVKSSVTFDLLAGVHVEKLSTTNEKSTAKINLYGNEIAQTITGNAGANIISDGGKGGSDTLVGLAGDDVYKVYNAGTVITEGAGQGTKDTVQSAVSYTLKAGAQIEVLATTNATGTAAISLYGNEFDQTVNGNAGANALRGYDGDDIINGGDGADKIAGGRGNDTLAGNGGADTYYFSYALNAATNVDTIKGFSSIDLISLSSAIFTKAGPAGALASAAFWASTTGLAHDSTDRIMWETDTGILRYDPDGTGSAGPTAFAIITGNTGAINAGDFVIA